MIRVIGILDQLEFVINCNNPKIHVVTVQDAVYLACYSDSTWIGLEAPKKWGMLISITLYQI